MVREEHIIFTREIYTVKILRNDQFETYLFYLISATYNVTYFHSIDFVI